jgi:hypothetical protein
MLHHHDALRDWKIVIKKNPKDAIAKARFEECSKIVKRDAFLKAIEISDAPAASEGLDVDSMAVSKDYDGVALDKETGMTQEFIDDMIQRFKDQKKLDKKYVYMIILKVMELVKAEPTMVETEVEEGTKLTVCGDTHGLWLDVVVYGIKLTQSQVNTLIFSKSSDSMVTQARPMVTCSMVISLIAAPGQLKLPFSSMLTSGCTPQPSS